MFQISLQQPRHVKIQSHFTPGCEEDWHVIALPFGQITGRPAIGNRRPNARDNILHKSMSGY